ncbi:MAG: DUF1704 domain-containing protein [Alphaproteobacteria bacterium]|nr:DUF1704 domain-containing protein [Alphaproteobacteria bacterium]
MTAVKRSWLSYKEQLRDLSDRLVRAQKPIRILDAINWDEAVQKSVIESKFKKMPKIGPEYYAEKKPLSFNAADKIEEIESIKRDLHHTIGESDDLGAILFRNCNEYQGVIRMLEARGTPEFHRWSKELYGSPKDNFLDQTTVRELGQTLYGILGNIDDRELGVKYEKDLSADDVVNQLNSRFEAYFHDHQVHVVLSDGIVADAAAGSDYVKIRRGGRFSVRDRDILEVHEGWVHVGTTLSGSHQRVATWLGKGPPSCTIIQEGLAVLMEVVTFNMTPHRARKVNNRILACDKAEDGADFLQVCEFYRTEGYNEAECYQHARRIFRGGVLKGEYPFTKDVVYAKGFVLVYNFLRTAIRFGRPDLIPFLFVGKVTLEDVPVLHRKSRAQIIDAPLYLPPQFRDLNGLACWMAYSNFLNRIDLGKVQGYYEKILAR